MFLQTNMATCKRCGTCLSTKEALLKHLQRKNPCPAVLEDVSREKLITETLDEFVQCTYCDKVFRHATSMYRHRKDCVKKNVQTQETTLKLQQEIEELRAAVAKLSQQPAVVGNNNNINNGTMVQNITINALGKEDISYITKHPNFKRFMVNCIRDKMDGVCEYLVKKHFDKQHPENHNIKKMNKKDDFMEVYDGSKWKVRYSDDILEDIFGHMYRDFANFVEEAFTEEGVVKRVWLDNFMKNVAMPLEWDLSTGEYEFEGEVSDENKKEIKTKIYKLACEYIYRHSKLVEEI